MSPALSRRSAARPVRLPLLPTALALALLLAATALRAYHFNEWPPGLSHDEAINGIDALRLLRTGVIPLYTRDGRPEPLFRFAQTLTIALVGPTRFGLRLASLYTGVLSVAAAIRAGRHFAPRGSKARRWIGLLAGGTLAVMVGHIHLSRVAYRAILLPLAILLFSDAFLDGVETSRRRSFALAGLWLAVTALSYTAGLIVIGVAGSGIALYLLAGLMDGKRPGADAPLRTRWLNTLAFGLAFLLAVSPLIGMLIIQPELYSRAQEVNGATFLSQPEVWLGRFRDTWAMIHRVGDINPQYNVAQTPLLHTVPLYGLLLLGLAGCLLRPRRPASWLAVALLIGGLLPVMLSNEIPHGLRITDAYAALPLLIAASADPLLWLAGRLSHPDAGRALRTGWALAMAGVLTWAGVRSARIYSDYFQSDPRWGDEGAVSALSWFFETRRLAVAGMIAEQQGVIYLPLSEAAHPALRYFTAASHPRVVTFATTFEAGPEGRLELPSGEFLIPPSAEGATTFVAFMPDGRLVLLPRFDGETLEGLDGALAASGRRIQDAQGELAATVVTYPPDGGSLTVGSAPAHGAGVNFDDQVSLTGWDGPETLPDEGGEIEVTLYFAPGPQRRRDLSVFTQLWTVSLERVASGPQLLLHRWLYPPGEWEEGDIVPLTTTLPVPGGLEPGAYRLAVGLLDYRSERLPVIGLDGLPVSDAAIAGTLKLPRSAPVSTEGMIPASARFEDEIELLGYRITDPAGQPVESLSPGQPVLVTLFWRAPRRPAEDYTIFLHLHDGTGELVAQNDSQPEGGQYPTGIWDAGEIVSTTHPLTPPPDSEGPFTLYTGLYRWPGLERLAVTQDGEAREDRRATLAAVP